MSLAARIHPPASDREARADALAARVAAELGLPAARRGVLRAGSAVLVGLPDVDVLVRVDAADRGDDARRQVAVARALAAADVPAIALAATDEQPLEGDGGAVTLWRYVEPVAERADVDEVARLARRLHDALRPLARTDGAGIPELDPLATVEGQLAVADRRGATSPAELAALRDGVEATRVAWAEVSPTDPLGRSLVHGDLHADNVVVGATGPVLADLEVSGWGPPSYDLVPQLVAVDRYGADPAGYDRFAAAYGFDVRSWAGCIALARTYELWVTAWALANRTISPRHEAEARRRLQGWLAHPDAEGVTDGPGGRWRLL